MANELTPATRVEKLLADILGEDYAVIPVTRIEKFLSNILGAEYDLIPATRIEKFLAKIAEEGGGGVTAEAVLTGQYPTGEVELYIPQISSNTWSGRKQITKGTVTTDRQLPRWAFMQNSGGSLTVIYTGSNTALLATTFQYNYFGYLVLRGNFTTTADTFNNDKTIIYDFEKITSIAGNCFRYNNRLNTIIFRGDTVRTLQATNAFADTPFTTGGSGGKIYVKQSLIDSYRSAANWSTLFNNNPNLQLLPIEGSIYETQYADGTPIS